MYTFRKYNYQILSYAQRLENSQMNSIRRKRINTAIQLLIDVTHEHLHCPLFKDKIIINVNERNLKRMKYFKIKDSNLNSAQILKISNIGNELFHQNVNRKKIKLLLSKEPNIRFNRLFSNV